MIYDNLSSIVCVDRKLGIGINNDIPWLNNYRIDSFSSEVILKYVKLDLKHFKKTRKKYDSLIVGSKTFKTLPSNFFSIPCLIVTNNYSGYDINYTNKYKEEYLDYDYKYLCIGGESIYNQLLPCSRYLYLSKWKNIDWGCNKFINKDYLELFKEIKIIFEDNDFKISKLENKFL